MTKKNKPNKAKAQSGLFEGLRKSYGFGWDLRRAFYRHLTIQSANGVPLERAIDGFLPRLHRSRKRYAASILAKVSRRYRDGKMLSDALQGHVPHEEIAAIRSGEIGGKLPDALTLIISSTNSVNSVLNAIKRAAFAPTVYALATFFLIWIIGRFVLPDIQQMLPAQRVQGLLAKSLYSLGDIANSAWAAAPPAIGLCIALWIRWAMPNWTNPARIAAERFFPFSFYRDIAGFRWLMSFTSLLGAGVPDVEILQIQTKGASPWLSQRLRSFHRAMMNGISLSGALLLRSRGVRPYGFPNPDIVDDIASFDGFPDSHIHIQALAREWAKDLEDRTLLRAARMGLFCELALFAVMGLLMVAINDLSSQISNVTGM